MKYLSKRSLLIMKSKCKLQFSVSTYNSKENYNLIHPESTEPKIPQYEVKLAEDIKTKKARLLYQSRKRGMLENGLILSTFADKYLKNFNEQQLQMYDKLINLPSNDWDIYNWATETKKTPAEFNNEIMDLLKKHVKNDKKEVRMKQPDL